MDQENLPSPPPRECSICLRDLAPGQAWTRTQCGHWYHAVCLCEAWARRPNCPLCRSLIDESLTQALVLGERCFPTEMFPQNPLERFASADSVSLRLVSQAITRLSLVDQLGVERVDAGAEQQGLVGSGSTEGPNTNTRAGAGRHQGGEDATEDRRDVLSGVVADEPGHAISGGGVAVDQTTAPAIDQTTTARRGINPPLLRHQHSVSNPTLSALLHRGAGSSSSLHSQSRPESRSSSHPPSSSRLHHSAALDFCPVDPNVMARLRLENRRLRRSAHQRIREDALSVFGRLNDFGVGNAFNPDLFFAEMGIFANLEEEEEEAGGEGVVEQPDHPSAMAESSHEQGGHNVGIEEDNLPPQLRATLTPQQKALLRNVCLTQLVDELFQYVAIGHLDAVKLILESGFCDVKSARDVCGNTALHFARHLEIVKLLVER